MENSFVLVLNKLIDSRPFWTVIGCKQWLTKQQDLQQMNLKTSVLSRRIFYFHYSFRFGN